MCNQSIKTAIFGGSFNPIHLGHIKVAQAVKTELNLDRVLLIPTYLTPLKDNSQMASAQDRYNMCKIMCQKYKDIFVSDIELKRQNKSYTVDTIRTIKKDNPTDTLFLIVGADMFMTLEKWKNPKTIFSYATVCTVPRNDFDYEKLLNKSKELKNIGANCHILKEAVMQVTSTEIRARVKENKTITHLVSKDVSQYINDNNLYRK